MCVEHPPEIGGQGSIVKCPRMHIHKILAADLVVSSSNNSNKNNEAGNNDPATARRLRDQVVHANSWDELWAAVAAVEETQSDAYRAKEGRLPHDVGKEILCWYRRHRNSNSNGDKSNSSTDGAVGDDKDEEACCG